MRWSRVLHVELMALTAEQLLHITAADVRPGDVRIHFSHHTHDAGPDAYASAVCSGADFLRLLMRVVGFAKTPCRIKRQDNLVPSGYTLGHICTKVFGHRSCNFLSCIRVVTGADPSTSAVAVCLQELYTDAQQLADAALDAVERGNEGHLANLQEYGALGTIVVLCSNSCCMDVGQALLLLQAVKHWKLQSPLGTSTKPRLQI